MSCVQKPGDCWRGHEDEVGGNDVYIPCLHLFIFSKFIYLFIVWKYVINDEIFLWLGSKRQSRGVEKKCVFFLFLFCDRITWHIRERQKINEEVYANWKKKVFVSRRDLIEHKLINLDLKKIIIMM